MVVDKILLFKNNHRATKSVQVRFVHLVGKTLHRVRGDQLNVPKRKLIVKRSISIRKVRTPAPHVVSPSIRRKGGGVGCKWGKLSIPL